MKVTLTIKLQTVTQRNCLGSSWTHEHCAATFLRKTDSSMTIRLRSIDDLTKLRLSERPEARSYVIINSGAPSLREWAEPHS